MTPRQLPAGERPLGRSGLTVGHFSLGLAPLANLGRVIHDDVAHATLEAAWERGVRYFDVAPHYGLGLGEERLGRFLATKPRSEFIVSTKVGRLLVANPDGPRPDDEGFEVVSALTRRLDYSADATLRSIDSSLDRLQLDSLDIAFIHDPDDHFDEASTGAVPALDRLRSEGIIRSWGAGMTQAAMLSRFLRETDLDVVMIAGRYTLLDQSAGADLLPLAVERSVSVVAAGVFNSGILARHDPGPDATYDYAPASGALRTRVRNLSELCDRYGVTVPDAAAQFPLRHPAVSTVCLGARTPEQVRQNADSMGVHIPEQFWGELVASGGLAHASGPARDIRKVS